MLLGTCTMNQRGVTRKMSYYSDGRITAAMAQMACTSFGGTWTPPAAALTGAVRMFSHHIRR
jgi:hypothetical protein